VTFFQRIKTPFIESPADEQAQLLQPRRRLVGELLQERREDLGLDLDEIGEMLRIKPGYLAALEQGRSHDLPGPTYAIGFVRAYADFLGLEVGSVLTRFKSEAAGVTARPDLAFPVPLGERSLPGGALVLVALIVALCGYGIWYYLSTEERNRPARVADVPAALQAPPTSPMLVSPPSPQQAAAPANVAAAGPSPPAAVPGSPPTAVTPVAGPSPSPTATPTPTLAPGALLSPIARAPAANSPNSPPPQQAAVPTASAAPTVPAPAANGSVPASRVAIRAVTDCWIQVRAADQSIVFSRVLKSGEVYNVPARAGLSLRTGNAGALQVSVDGKPAPSIGSVGTLRRDVALDPTELAAGTAVHG
jgi:cytoskeleton protein RodZ